MLNFTMKSLVMKDPSWYKLSALHKTRPQRSWPCSAYQNDSLSLNSSDTQGGNSLRFPSQYLQPIDLAYTYFSMS